MFAYEWFLKEPKVDPWASNVLIDGRHTRWKLKFYSLPADNVL